jgi:hypothetical protein
VVGTPVNPLAETGVVRGLASAHRHPALRLAARAHLEGADILLGQGTLGVLGTEPDEQSSPRTPTAILPATRNAIPPNILFSLTFSRVEITLRTPAASSSS